MIENNNKPVITIENLTKKFKKVIANDDISFTINKGDNIAIIGANGSGKTTLVEQIIGVSKPTKGKIVYNFKYNMTPQEKMGMQFQDSSYPIGLSVKNIIDFSLDIYGSSIKKGDLDKLLKIFKVSDFYKKSATGLSGGQQQKLNVLLAVVHKPEIVILDEISTGLDIAAKNEIIGFVKDYVSNKSITSILVSHNMDEVKDLSNRIIVINKGKLIADTTSEALIKKYKTLNKYMNLVLKGRHND